MCFTLQARAVEASRSQIFLDDGAGASNFCPGSTDIVMEEASYVNNTLSFSDFLDKIVLESEAKVLSRYWSRSQNN